MKTKVYKYRFLLSGLPLAMIMCLFFFSCQKEEIVPINEPFDYEQIGIEHNRGLNYVFEYLKNKEVSKKSYSLKSGANIYELIEEATLSFTKTLEYQDNVNLSQIKLTFRSFESNLLKNASIDDLNTTIKPHIMKNGLMN